MMPLDAYAIPSPTFTDTCNAVAHDFRALARDAYERGDEGAGDRLTTRALAWELARDTGDLGVLRERP